MEMQSVPVCEAFHEGCSIGNRWPMPPAAKVQSSDLLREISLKLWRGNWLVRDVSVSIAAIPLTFWRFIFRFVWSVYG